VIDESKIIIEKLLGVDSEKQWFDPGGRGTRLYLSAIA